MNIDHPVAPLDECLQYITRNAWQLKLLDPSSPVKIRAEMLRSFYWHLAQAYGISIIDLPEISHDSKKASVTVSDAGAIGYSPHPDNGS